MAPRGFHVWWTFLWILVAGIPGGARVAFGMEWGPESVVVTNPAVSVTIFHGHAVATVRARLWNHGSKPEVGGFPVELPDLGAVTALRVRDRLHGRSVLREAELLEAGEAEREYKHSSVPSAFETRVLMSRWSWRQAGFEVTPIHPGQESFVEYEMTLATRYHDGVEELTLPDFGSSRVTLRAADPRDKLRVEGRTVAQGGSLAVEHREAAKPRVMATSRSWVGCGKRSSRICLWSLLGGSM